MSPPAFTRAPAHSAEKAELTAKPLCRKCREALETAPPEPDTQGWDTSYSKSLAKVDFHFLDIFKLYNMYDFYFVFLKV